MRKVSLMIVGLLMAIAAQAQYYNYQNLRTPFHENKVFLGASMSGFDFNYSDSEDVKIDLKAQLGYMFFDNVLGYGEVGYNNGGKGPHSISVGAGFRYYIEQNGLFLGAKLNFIHANKNYNDLLPGVEIGYAYFLSRSVTIEPAIYYNQSIKKHSDYSNIGIRVGLGIYLND